MIFSEICKIFVFIEKEINERKEKSLHGLGPTHSEAGPTARIQPRLKKSPSGEAHSDLDILYHEF
jgi:hypothetical protein